MATRPEQGFAGGGAASGSAKRGDNIMDHPASLVAMPVFLMVAYFALPQMSELPLLGPFAPVGVAFAVQGVIIAAALQYFARIPLKSKQA